ncbi:MAG: hypothetical protein ACYC7K_08200, partial [Desulfobacteria bacterium]
SSNGGPPKATRMFRKLNNAMPRAPFHLIGSILSLIIDSGSSGRIPDRDGAAWVDRIPHPRPPRDRGRRRRINSSGAFQHDTTSGSSVIYRDDVIRCALESTC